MSDEITSFTVRGLRNGSQVHVHWERGAISGDPPTVDLLLVNAELAGSCAADRMVERAGMVAASATPLAEPASAVAFVCAALDRVTEVSPAALRGLAGLEPA